MRLAAVALLTVAAALPGAASSAPPRVSFEASVTRLVVTAPGYRLALSARNGALLELVDRRTGTRLVRGSLGCAWAALATSRARPDGGCRFRRGGERRFSHRWDARRTTLTLRFDDAGGIGGTATVTARASWFDLRLTLRNRSGATYEQVAFPVDLYGDATSVRAGYGTNFLPGIRLAREFFLRPGNSVRTYPSRWAFADFLAFDAGGSHLALYSVNAAPAPIRPVALGFTRSPAGSPCSGTRFCVAHAYQTWIRPGETWRSPAVRIRVGEPVEQTILAFRRDNGIDRYPSLAAKLGPRLETLARAALVKADVTKGAGAFRTWGETLRRLPSPSLLHPVSFQPGGHDETFPDFLPPDPLWGTTEELRAAVEDARALGHAVVPYLNVSWWDADSPSARALGAEALAVRNRVGEPVGERYGHRDGLVASPHAPGVRERIARLLGEWRDTVPVDCLFFDQIGARPWRLDFHPAGPSPLAYADGWLAALAPYADRCLMVEDGWDRLARDFAAFHGGILMVDREHDEPDESWGAGNWEPFPLANWLLRDKVLLYQHDLYERTMAGDAEVVAFNVLHGVVHSYDWHAESRSLESPWLEVAALLQRTLGPLQAGRPLASYRRLGDRVSESRFGELRVLGNLDPRRAWAVDGHRLAPHGFLARTDDGRILAGAFEGRFNGAELPPGVHYLVLERHGGTLTVRRPLGADGPLAVEPPGPGALRIEALGADETVLGRVPGALHEGKLVFEYRGDLAGDRVAAYRIGPA